MEKDFYYIELYEIYGELLTKNQKDAFYSHFCLDLSLAEIAEGSGVGRQSVFDMIKSAKAKLDKLESALKLKCKFDELKNIAKNTTDKELSTKLYALIGE